jgi:hypothetical protein
MQMLRSAPACTYRTGSFLLQCSVYSHVQQHNTKRQGMSAGEQQQGNCSCWLHVTSSRVPQGCHEPHQAHSVLVLVI